MLKFCPDRTQLVDGSNGLYFVQNSDRNDKLELFLCLRLGLFDETQETNFSFEINRSTAGLRHGVVGGVINRLDAKLA